MIEYLSVAQVLALHRLQLERFGGTAGLLDRGGLDSAVHRPRATFAGEDLYPDVPAKAAALLHSLVQNQPFADGNKRVGAHAMLVFLVANGHEPLFSPDELAGVTLAVARGDLEAPALAIWIRQRTRVAE